MTKNILLTEIKRNDMVDFSKLTSDDLLELALRCRNNAVVLRDSANKELENESSKNHALFDLYTASEEVEKGLFCLLAHRGFMKNTQLEPVFRKHKTKIILFKMLFRNRKFYIENGQFYYDGTLFEDLDLEALADTDKTIYRDYMDKRNDCLYVRPNDDGSTYDPSDKPQDIETRRQEIVDSITYRWAWFDIVWSRDFVGNISDLDYYKLTPKDKPEKPNVTFSGTGTTIKREEKDYFPDSVKKRLGKI